MPQQPAQPTTRPWSPEQVRAQVAATYQLLARSRHRAAQAMAQVRYVDQLLHASGQPADTAEPAEPTPAKHLVDTMEHEVAAHDRAAALHETAAQLQEDAGWPERAATARKELTAYQTRAAAAQEQVDELHKRSP